MNNEVYANVIAQILRHFLMLTAGFLGSIGVEQATAGLAINYTVSVVTPLILVGVATGWGIFQKRFAVKLTEAAFLANPATTTLAEVKQAVVFNNTPPDSPV